MVTQKRDPDSHRCDNSTPLLLEVAAVCHSYREGSRARQVLNNVSLQLSRGESVAILGRSGCGKSTLLNLISGIEQLQSGSIRFDGTALEQLDESKRTRLRRTSIGFVYQFFHLLPTLSVAENIALVLELNGYDPESTRRRVTELLALVDLADRGGSFPDRLSGGEQQRVAIARAIAHRPALILADEPTGNLDADTGASVLALLTGLVRRDQAALILVTHSLEVSELADRLLTLTQGQLTERQGDFT